MRSTPFNWHKSSYSGNRGDCVEVSLNWRKASYSGNQGGDCVEVADAAHQVHVRDTQNRPLGHLTFTASNWSALLSSLRNGDTTA